MSKRDKTTCAMLLAEAQVISAFQILYFAKKSKTAKLSGEELYTLKAAVKCYKTFKDFTIEAR